jgi:hypothetical protein
MKLFSKYIITQLQLKFKITLIGMLLITVLLFSSHIYAQTGGGSFQSINGSITIAAVFFYNIYDGTLYLEPNTASDVWEELRMHNRYSSVGRHAIDSVVI